MATSRLNLYEFLEDEYPVQQVQALQEALDSVLTAKADIVYTANSNKTFSGSKDSVVPFLALDITATVTLTTPRYLSLAYSGVATEGGHLYLIRNQANVPIIVRTSNGVTTTSPTVPADSKWYLFMDDTDEMQNLGSYPAQGTDLTWDGSDIDFGATLVYKTTATATPTLSNPSVKAKAYIEVDTGGSITMPASVTVLEGTSPATAGKWVEIWCIDDQTPEYIAWIR